MILALVLVSTTGCSQEEITPIDESNKLLGHWINPVYAGTEIQLTRANSLKSNEYGISFLAESQCVERSSGWCGTPPLVYSDFKGSWTRTDAVVLVTISNGIGLNDIKWSIKTLDDKTLIMERLY